MAAFKKGWTNRRRCKATKRDGAPCGHDTRWSVGVRQRDVDHARHAANRREPRRLPPTRMGSLSGNGPRRVPRGLTGVSGEFDVFGEPRRVRVGLIVIGLVLALIDNIPIFEPFT